LIAKELATWGIAMPGLLARISDVLKWRSLSGHQKLELEVLARRITASFKAIGDVPEDGAANATNYAQLIEKTNDLREQIAAAKEALARAAK
jgi:hypothetical protein